MAIRAPDGANNGDDDDDGDEGGDDGESFNFYLSWLFDDII